MLASNDIIKFLSEHLSSLKDEYHISKLGLFGSFARNEQNDSSDIDIILEFKEDTENIYEKKSRLKDFLTNHFQRDVDLCREKYLKPYVKDYLRNEIIYV
ncbi:nucleotidyltransferase domain-containing protein [Desulfobulbus sp. F5]|nr:nucleotidyltransferase domain-containing protein [Desulfobulbus sp. F5]